MDQFIRIIFQVSYLGGLAWIVMLLAEHQFQKRTQRFRHRFQHQIERIQILKRLWLFRHIDGMLYLTSKKYQPGVSAVRFILRCVYLIVIVFVSLLIIKEFPRITYENPFMNQGPETTSMPWAGALVVALIIGTIPYLLLRIRYSQNVVKASYDLAEVVKIMSRYAHLSISSALRHTGDDLPASNVLKRPVHILASVFSSYGTVSELQSEAIHFSKAIGTTFSTQFVMDLLFFEKEGVQLLKQSLLFLNDSIENQRQAILRAKNENRDAISLGIWVNAFVISLTTVFGIQALSLHVFLKLLLQTTVGLYMASFVMLSFIVAFFIGRVLSRPKLDY